MFDECLFILFFTACFDTYLGFGSRNSHPPQHIWCKITTSTVSRLPGKYEPVGPLADQPANLAIPANQISGKTVNELAKPSSSQPAVPPALLAYPLPTHQLYQAEWPMIHYDAGKLGCTRTSGWNRPRQRLQPLSMLQTQYV